MQWIDYWRSLLNGENPLSELVQTSGTNYRVIEGGEVTDAGEDALDGKLYIMESVDFTARDKERAKDHAGLASFMFEDLKKEFGDNVHTIAIVQYRPEDKQDSESVRYGLSILQSESNELTEWLNPEEQRRFIDARKRIAFN